MVNPISLRPSSVLSVKCSSASASVPRVASVAEDHHVRHGQIVSVRDGEQRRAAADRGQTPGGAAVEYQLRWTSAPDDLDIAPHDALRVAGTERLHPGFFGCKPPGEM